MRIKGIEINKPNIEVLVLPRPMGTDIIFKAQAVIDFEPFNKLCPEPQPPSILYRNGDRKLDVEDAAYKKEIGIYGLARTHWMILKSLEATEGLEWETVEPSKSETWGNFREELKKGGFSEIEQGRIISAVMVANCLDESRVQEARERFLRSQQEQPSK